MIEQRPAMDWFEVISENYLVDGGSPLYRLDRLLEGYPVVQQRGGHVPRRPNTPGE